MSDLDMKSDRPESRSTSLSSNHNFEGDEVVPLPPNEGNDSPLGKIETSRSKHDEEQGDGTLASQQILHGVPLISCALSLLCCMFLVALDQTIIATLLSTVGEQFDSFGDISWVSTGFLLPTCVLAMSWGKISIIFGRKYTMLVAIVLFEAGSLLCALAKSMNMLIGGRVLAGVGGGGIQVLVFMIMTEIVSIEKRGLLQGLVGASFGIASVMGPLVGGAFTSDVTWRWCFYINLPIGGVAFVLISYFFRPPRAKGSLREKLARIDYIGTFLLALGLVLVLLALTFGSSSTKAWNSPMIIAFFVVGGVVFLGFLGYNFTLSKNPLLPSAVVSVFYVDIVAACMFCVFGAFLTAALYLAIYFQVVRNADAMHSGIDLLPMIVPVVICSIVGGILITKTRYVKPFAIFGTLVGSIGFGLLTLLDQNSGLGQRIGFLLLPGIGIGSLLQSLTLNIQLNAPKRDGGVMMATAFLAFLRAMGGIFGSTIGQTVLFVVFKQHLAEANLPPGVDYTAYINSPAAIHQLPPEQRDAVIGAFVKGFQGSMYFALGLFLAGFCMSLCFSNTRIPKVDKNAMKVKKDVEENAGQQPVEAEASVSSLESAVLVDGSEEKVVDSDDN
jgi:MFS family permease